MKGYIALKYILKYLMIKQFIDTTICDVKSIMDNV